MNNTLMLALAAGTILVSISVAVLSIVLIIPKKESEIYISERHDSSGKELPKRGYLDR